MNGTLIRYYKSALSRLVWVIVLLALFVEAVMRWLVTWSGGDSGLVHFVGRALSYGSIAALFLFAEGLIRKRLWKLAYPELDLSGVWRGGTTYEQRRIAGPGQEGQAFVPFRRPNDVLLEQDALGITVKAGTSPVKGTWQSLAAHLDTSESSPAVRYAYEVEYGGVQGFPHDAIGYEKLSVVAPQEGLRPRELSGTFAHCARGQTPVYSGSVAFARDDEAVELSGWQKVLRWSCILIARLGKPKV